MRILVIDGQGGGLGHSIVEKILDRFPQADLTVLGTNAMATANMMRGGAKKGATGENAIRYNCARADVILGPVGIILPNAMLGEISPAVSEAVLSSPAEKLLFPVSNAHKLHVLGHTEKTWQGYFEEAVKLLEEFEAQQRESRAD